MTVIDDIMQNLEELQTSVGEVSDTVGNHDDAIATLNDGSGKLSFPIDEGTIDLIKECFPVGSVALSGGSATIVDPRISTNSLILLTRSTAAGTLGELSYVASGGSALIGSTIPTGSTGADNSTIVYMLLT